MSVQAALQVLLEQWWQTVADLDTAALERVAVELARLPDEPAKRATAEAELLVLLAAALPPDHPVLRAARQDPTRSAATAAAPDQLVALGALAATSTATTSYDLTRLDPADVGAAAGLHERWRPGTPIDANTALRLWELDTLLRRIRHASGSEDLSAWFATPSPQLGGRTPRDIAASGDLAPLHHLAASLETFTVS